MQSFLCFTLNFAIFVYDEQRVKQIYQNVENGPTAYFYLCDEIKTIGLSFKTDKWKMPQESLINELQVYIIV